MNEIFESFLKLILIIFGFYFIFPIIINIIAYYIEEFMWNKYYIDWNISDNTGLVSRRGKEILNYLKLHKISIHDVIRNPEYYNDGYLDINKLKKDIESNNFKENIK